MPKFYVRQRKPVWVCFIQEVEAESEEQAIEIFEDSYDPCEHRMESYVPRLDHGPVTAWPADQYALKEVFEAE